MQCKRLWYLLLLLNPIKDRIGFHHDVSLVIMQSMCLYIVTAESTGVFSVLHFIPSLVDMFITTATQLHCAKIRSNKRCIYSYVFVGAMEMNQLVARAQLGTHWPNKYAETDCHRTIGPLGLRWNSYIHTCSFI